MRLPTIFALICVALTCCSPSRAHCQDIFWVEQSFGAASIGSAGIDGSGLQTLALDPASLPEAIALRGNGSIYWTDLLFVNAGIHHCPTPFGSVTTVVSGGSALRGLVLDEGRQEIYWLSSNLQSGPRLFRAPLAGGSPETLAVLGPGSNPRDLAIDTARQQLYWCEFDEGCIRRVDASPGALSLAVVSGLKGPCGIVFDPASRSLYWTEMQGNRICRTSVDSARIDTVLSNLHRPAHLTLDAAGSRIFWSELDPPAIRSADIAGSSITTIPVSVFVPGGIAVSRSLTAVRTASPLVPASFDLAQNYPNPFNPSTTIQFAVGPEGRGSADGEKSVVSGSEGAGIGSWRQESSSVRLVVYDVLGREVSVLVDERKSPGLYQVEFSARDIPSGAYFYRLQAGTTSMSRRMLVIK